MIAAADVETVERDGHVYTLKRLPGSPLERTTNGGPIRPHLLRRVNRLA
jgi:hypothetical protein